MTKDRMVSVKMSAEDIKKLHVLAKMHNTSMHTEITKAIEKYIEMRVNEEGFQEKLEAAKQNFSDLLDTLKKPTD